MKFTIRRAKASDSAEIAELFIRVRAQMAYLPRLHTDNETREFIAHVIETDEVWIAENPDTKLDRVTGFAAIHDEPKKIWLDHLYIASIAQGQGHGAALLDKVKTQRPQGFSLWTFQQNSGARRFYERHGLTLARLTDGRDNEEKLPDALYVWAGDKNR